MPGIASLEAFQRGVHEFDIDTFQLDIEPAALEAARRSLDDSGLLLLGEVHGVRQNSLIARELMSSLDITGLALEWPAGLASAISGFFEGRPSARSSAAVGRRRADHRRAFRHAVGALLRRTAARADPVRRRERGRLVPARGGEGRDGRADPDRAGARGTHAGDRRQRAHRPGAERGSGIPLGARLREQRSGVREVQIGSGNGGYYNLSPQRFKRQWSLHHRARLRLEGARPGARPARARSGTSAASRAAQSAFAAPRRAQASGAFPAYNDAQPLTGPQRQPGPPRQGQATGPFPAHGTRIRDSRGRLGAARPAHLQRCPIPTKAYADRAYPGQPHGAPHHQPRPGYPAEPGQPPFIGNPQQSQPNPTGCQGQRRALPYEVELPAR